MTRRLRWLLPAGALGIIATTALAFSFLGSRWPGSRIVMTLQLGNSGPLLDGASSWDAVAEGALAIWNRYLANVQFAVVRGSPDAPGDGDGVNNVFFSSTIFGRSFDGAVAVTTEWARNNGRTRIEADVIFNSNLRWNSYRGDLRRAAAGGTLYDLRRVAMHEFGHVLGLDHPDEDGQRVTALMNSRVSDIDGLRTDDIRGGQALYGARLERFRASFKRPMRSSVRTSSARYLFRGRADVAQASAVLLVNNRLGVARFYRATGLQTWRRSLSLRPGTNRIRLYVRTPSGGRVKVDERIVTRTGS